MSTLIKDKSDFVFKVITIALLATASIALCSQLLAPSGMPRAPGTAAGGNNAVVTVSTQLVEPERIESFIRINGDIASKSEVTVYPDTAGKIIRIEVSEGSSVEKGTVLMYIDPSKPGSSYAASPVKSPVKGTVTDIPVTVGDTLTAATGAAVIGSLDDLEITVSVAEKYSTYLTPGKRAYVTLNSLPDTPFNAFITSVSPVVNKTTRTFAVKLDFDRYDPRIKPGMFGSVRLVLQDAEDTIVIPKTAVSTYNSQPVVYIVSEDGTSAVRREISRGMENDTSVQITGGLSMGETVITAGSVTDGSNIRIANQQETSL